jgi:hypothetical protein
MGGPGRELLCPSAQPEQAGATVFAVIGGTVTEPRAGYLEALQPVTADLLALAEPVAPTEVFRIAAPCAQSDGSSCTLAQRTAAMLDEVTERLPACRIRPRCRWFAEQGAAACRRCPQVVTTNLLPSPAVQAAAQPPSS